MTKFFIILGFDIAWQCSIVDYNGQWNSGERNTG